jgi:hypothetical protein
MFMNESLFMVTYNGQGLLAGLEFIACPPGPAAD